jgi:thiaminase
MNLNTERLDQLQNVLSAAIKKRQNSENTQRLMGLEKLDRRIYGIYLVETYHYTRHNTRNQALVACREEKLDVNYSKFCLKHAMEEAGHEYLALADLNSMGIDFAEEKLSSPLPETEALIGYLYRVAETGNPYARLGYSYWAESVYGFTNTSRTIFQELLKLKDNQMTFLVAHAKIDEDHFEDIKITLSRFCKTDADWQAVEECMLQTLAMTGKVMDQVIGQYLDILDGKPSRYGFLQELEYSTK